MQTHLLRIVLACCCTLFMVAPLQAQTGVAPTPEPTIGVSLDTLSRAVDALERLSSSNTNTVNAAVVLQSVFNLIIFGGGLLFVWRGGLKPLHETMQSDRQRATKAEADEERVRLEAAADKRFQDELRLKHTEAIKATAEELGRVATILNETETRAQARANAAVEAVNTHTTNTISEAKAQLVAASDKIEAAAKDIQEVVTKAHLDGKLTPILDELRRIRERLLMEHPVSVEPPADAPLTDGKSLPEA